MLSRCRLVPSGGGGTCLLKTASRGAFRKNFGWVESATMSACFVIDQKGS
jgi:hypothetical protein